MMKVSEDNGQLNNAYAPVKALKAKYTSFQKFSRQYFLNTLFNAFISVDRLKSEFALNKFIFEIQRKQLQQNGELLSKEKAMQVFEVYHNVILRIIKFKSSNVSTSLIPYQIGLYSQNQMCTSDLSQKSYRKTMLNIIIQDIDFLRI
ncbi:hypothetical protein ABPG74_015959 [Tetrahymena malaccensis]